MTESIKDITLYLFDCDFFSDDFDPEGKEEHPKYNEPEEAWSSGSSISLSSLLPPYTPQSALSPLLSFHRSVPSFDHQIVHLP